MGAEVSAQHEYLGEEISADVREVLLTITLEAKQGEATLYLSR